MDSTAVAEATADVVENALDNVDAVKSNKGALIVVGIGGVLIGASLSFVVTKHLLKTKYEQLAEQEIRQAKAYYQNLYVKPDLEVEDEAEVTEEEAEVVVQQTEMLQEAVEIMEKQEYTPYNHPEQAPEPQPIHDRLAVQESIKKNIWDHRQAVANDDFDLDVEEDKKKKGQPYIVEAEYFFENEDSYSQSQFTYYEGDRVLADENEEQINNWMQIIGHDNLHFGRGSQDAHIVYICNDRLNAMYEVSRSEGKYSVEVAGFLEHSDRPKTRQLRRFRDSDD